MFRAFPTDQPSCPIWSVAYSRWSTLESVKVPGLRDKTPLPTANNRTAAIRTAHRQSLAFIGSSRIETRAGVADISLGGMRCRNSPGIHGSRNAISAIYVCGARTPSDMPGGRGQTAMRGIAPLPRNAASCGYHPVDLESGNLYHFHRGSIRRRHGRTVSRHAALERPSEDRLTPGRRSRHTLTAM